MMTLLAAALCGFANWIRGGLFGETIKAALRALHPAIEAAWRSVGDRLLTTAAGLALVAWLCGAGWAALAAWPALYAGFVMGWPWIGMGRLNEGSSAAWAASRASRGRWLAGLAEDIYFGPPSQFWTARERWAYDAACLAMRGLDITAPAGLVLTLGGVSAFWMFAGLTMPLAYEAGQHLPGKLRGTAGGEVLFGALLGAALVMAGV